ncbi:hypothetical protein [Halomonas subglaciescola]|nr:hypothetical protein [Halomonas subglaciescola]
MLGVFVGQVMKALRNTVSPQQVNALLKVNSTHCVEISSHR